MPVPTEVSPRASHSHSHSHSALSLGPIVTHDLQRGSPTPKFEVEKPRRRSLSPMPSSAPSSSKTIYTPPPLTWRTAFQDAKAGIHYTKDSFPSSSFLPPPFSREPVKVEAAERVEILEEVEDYAVRVRVLRTGDVGLIPLWNTEGALERLTRINTAFNEAATCPVEARALLRRDSESSATSCWDDGHSPTDASLSHVHARCIPFATRVRFPDYYGASSPFSDCDDDSDSDSSLHSPRDPYERGRTPFSAHHACSQPKVYEAQPRTLEQGGISETSARSHSGGRQKSVNFVEGERPQVVFRYPSEELVGAFLGEETEGGADARVEEKEEEHDGEWWWHGWEEMREELEEETRGRGRETRGCARPSVDGPSGVAQMLSSVDEEERFPSVFYEDDDL